MTKETTAQEPKQKSRKDLFMERMQGRYPDDDFGNEDNLYGRLAEDYDGYDAATTREREFGEMMSDDPRLANVVMAFSKNSKQHPLAVIYREFGPDAIELLKNPEEIPGFVEAQKEWVDRKTEGEKYEKTYNENIAATHQLLDKMEDEGMPADKLGDIVTHVKQIAEEFLQGKITAETIDMVKKSLDYDSDVSEASAVGEIKGRNAKIEEKLRKKKGDGTPAIPSGGSAPIEKPKKNLGALGVMANRKSIWD